MTKACELIQDLLPLYADNVCSEESRKEVAQHIAECDSCKEMLRKMDTQLVVQADKDIKVIRSVKKRILTEKIASAAVIAIFIIGIFTGIMFHLINTDCTMDYEKYNLAENIAVKQDENGDVWLVRKNEATLSWFVFPDVMDENGNKMSDKGFEREKAEAMTYTLKQRKIDSFLTTTKFMTVKDVIAKDEYTLLFNVNEKEKINEIYYYDDKTDKDYLLWEREN